MSERFSVNDIINIVDIELGRADGTNYTLIVTLDDLTPGLKVVPVSKLDSKPFFTNQNIVSSVF